MEKNNIGNLDLEVEISYLRKASSETRKEVDKLWSVINSNEKQIEELKSMNNSKNVTEIQKRQVEVEKTLGEVDDDIKTICNIAKDRALVEITKKRLEGQNFSEMENDIFNLKEILRDFLHSYPSKVNNAFSAINNKIGKMLEESLDFEKAFTENFSCLTHSEGQATSSPGFEIFKRKNYSFFGNLSSFVGLKSNVTVKERKIQIKFKSKEPVYGGHKNERCARILTVESNTSIMPKFKSIQEITILIVGVTGAGKSTLIDAIANFYYNVRYEDEFRLKLVDLLEGEMKKTRNQAVSQTDEITVYKLPHLPNGNASQIRLTIIDTPGVADTRGIKQDKLLLEKLRYLFESGKVPTLTSICFVSNAGNPRLTDGQRYIFDALITNFGKDLRNNILGLFTFDDGGTPKALDAFQAANIGLSAWFKFNSRALVEERVFDTKVTKTIMMTEEARSCLQFQQFYKNCDSFIGTLLNMKGIDTKITAQVNKIPLVTLQFLFYFSILKVMQKRSDLEEKRYILNSKLTYLLHKKEEVR